MIRLPYYEAEPSLSSGTMVSGTIVTGTMVSGCASGTIVSGRSPGLEVPTSSTPNFL